MIAVVLDTNAIHSDPWLASDPAAKLLDRAASGSCVVVHHRIVIEELLRQRRKAAQRAHDQAAATWPKRVSMCPRRLQICR